MRIGLHRVGVGLFLLGAAGLLAASWSWANPAAPRKVAEGAVEADKDGLVTVEKFEINRAGWGNRLVIRASAE